jgi:hypothetical protein
VNRFKRVKKVKARLSAPSIVYQTQSIVRHKSINNLNLIRLVRSEPPNNRSPPSNLPRIWAEVTEEEAVHVRSYEHEIKSSSPQIDRQLIAVIGGRSIESLSVSAVIKRLLILAKELVESDD